MSEEYKNIRDPTTKTKGKKFNQDSSTGKGKRTTGLVEELGNNVFLYGTRSQGETFIQTKDAIAEYIVREYGRDMHLLIKDGKDSMPQEPTKPTASTTPDPFEMKKYENDLDCFYKKSDKC